MIGSWSHGSRVKPGFEPKHLGSRSCAGSPGPCVHHHLISKAQAFMLSQLLCALPRRCHWYSFSASIWSLSLLVLLSRENNSMGQYLLSIEKDNACLCLLQVEHHCEGWPAATADCHITDTLSGAGIMPIQEVFKKSIQKSTHGFQKNVLQNNYFLIPFSMNIF